MESITKLKSGVVTTCPVINNQVHHFFFDVGSDQSIIILDAWSRVNIFLKAGDSNVSDKKFTWKAKMYKKVRIEIDPRDDKK